MVHHTAAHSDCGSVRRSSHVYQRFVFLFRSRNSKTETGSIQQRRPTAPIDYNGARWISVFLTEKVAFLLNNVFKAALSGGKLL